MLIRGEAEAVPEERRDVGRYEAVLGQVLDVLLMLEAALVVAGELLVRHGADAPPLLDDARYRRLLGEVEKLPQLVVPALGAEHKYVSFS